MRFHPKALLVTGAFFGLLWLSLAQHFSLAAIIIDAAVGWGLWALPEDWPRLRRPPRRMSGI